MADLLLEAGADPLSTSVAGRAPLHELFCRPVNDAHIAPSQPHPSRTRAENPSCAFARKERRAVMRSLLHWGGDAQQPDRNQGMTPMHYCAREGAEDCLMELLSYLSVQNPSSKRGDGGEDRQLKRKSAKITVAERERCGPYFRCMNGRTSLHTACVSSAFSVIDLLTRWDADNAIIGSTRMCLQLSRASQSFSLPGDEAQYDEYCLATIRDCNGKTPSQLIGQSGRDETIVTFWERCFAGDLARFVQWIFICIHL